MSTLFDDVRYAWRMLLKTRGATAAALVAFALGLGANLAAYSIADALLFRPLLLKEVDRLVQVSTRHPGSTFPNDLTAADFREIGQQARTIEGLAATVWTTTNLTGLGQPEQVRAFRVTANFFSTLTAQPLLGRTFAPDEDTPGRDDRLVLGHALWTRLGADPTIVGRTVRLNDRPYEVMGVMPIDLRYPPQAELWIPLALSPKDWEDRDSSYLGAVARLAPNASIGDANAEVAGLMARIAADHPVTHRGRRAQAAALADTASGNLAREFMLLMLGAVAFVLIIACANVVNLQFARIAGRTRELAIRTALGATRWRVVRQLVVEGLLLSLAGCAAAVLLADWCVGLMRADMPAEVRIHLPGWDRLGVNSHVLAYGLVLATIAGTVAGLAAAFVARRAEPVTALKDGSRGSAGAGRQRVKSALVLCQVGLSLVLLIGGGLMVKGARTLSNPLPDAGADQVLTTQIVLPAPKYEDPSAQRTFSARAIEALAAIPGASSPSLISELPYSGEGRSTSFRIEGAPVTPPGERSRAHARSISEGHFATLRMPVHAGRAFGAGDAADTPAVAIVNDAFARRHFPQGDAVGRRLATNADNANPRWITIVGVVGDVLHDWTDRTPQPTLYRPLAQAPRRSLFVAIRSAGDPQRLVPSIRAAIAAIDPDQPLSAPITLRAVIDHYLVGLVYLAAMMSAFGLAALTLAVIGLYALLAFDVAERTREIGVRIALGASAADVLRLVVSRGFTLTAAGVALGLIASLAMARWLGSLFFGVGSHDMTAFAAVSLLLLLTALAACALPARRAARIDPMICLRDE